MREVRLPDGVEASEATTFAACLATILDLPYEEVPTAAAGEDVAGWRTSRWLGGRALGLVPIDEPSKFSWAGPWIGLIRAQEGRRAVVRYGVPSGVVFDPAPAAGEGVLEGGYAVAALDIALALPRPTRAPTAAGVVESIHVAPAAGEPSVPVDAARAIAGAGLEGDRHVAGTGTFPSGLPGSALTLIEAEVCESFTPALAADEHRRNVVTRGIELNDLVGHEFTIGEVLCRGMRLCEPCTVVDGYSDRAILRPLVHRGGLRADIIADGTIRVGDRVGAPGVY
jgi:MOSC domain-containing protein YiiM